jgi:hypothetical protein
MQSLPLFVTTIPLESLTVCVQFPAESPGAVARAAFAGIGERKLMRNEKIKEPRRNKQPDRFSFLPACIPTSVF